jgi:hypothetical protein
MGLVAKAFQDIITFSRATAGTYVNSNGYITNSSVLNYLTYSNAPDNAAWSKSNSFVQTNLLLQSEDFTTTWSNVGPALTISANAAISPIGTLTADLLTPTTGVAQHRVDQTPVSSAGLQTFSVYAKSNGYPWISLRIGGIGKSFNVSTGVVGSTGAATSATIENAGNGWYRCSIHLAAALANDICRINVENADAIAAVFAGDGVSGAYFWGAQCVQGSVPGDYQATTSAALPVLYSDYNGVVRARKLAETTAAAAQHSVQISASMNAGQLYTISVYAKSSERGYVYIQVNDNITRAVWTSFNLSNGTVALAPTALTGSFADMTSSVTAVSNGYYRVQFTFTNAVAATGSFYVGLSDNGTNRLYTGDGSSGIYIADAQLNDGSTATAYYDTTASAYNAPRFDYDPVTLAAKGLLIEEQRVNLLTYSDGTIANLTSSNNVTNATSALNPSFTNSIQFGDNTLQRIAYKIATTTAATAYTLSVFVRMDDNSTPVVGATITSGDFGLVFEGNLISVASTVTAFGNSTHRVQVTVTAAGGAGLNVGVIKYTGQSAKGFRITGFQLEAGAFATSYIPTTTSQVTRAADVASVNTLSPWYNSVAGTFYFEGDTVVPASLVLRNLTSMNDATVNNLNRTYLYNGTVGGSTTTGGVTQADIGGGSYTVNTVFKFAYATAANNFAAVLNGGAPATDALGTMPSGLTTFEIASSFAGTVNTGHIRRITYYPRRMTNAELQTLTTL